MTRSIFRLKNKKQRQKEWNHSMVNLRRKEKFKQKFQFDFIRFYLHPLVNQNDNKCGINTQKDTKKEKDKLKRDRSLPEILMRPQWPQRAFIARPKKATNFDTKFYSKSQWNVIFRDAAVSTLCQFYKKLTAKWTKLIEKYWNDVIAPVE